MPVHNRIVTATLAIFIFLFAMWQFLPVINEREFHRDEARWIHRAEYVRELLHPFGDYWDESSWSEGESMDARNRLRAQPPMGSYLMGIGFLMQGQPLPDIGYWNMDHDTIWNTANGNMPSGEMLTAARRTTATLTALTAVMLFLIGTRLTTTAGAAIGALFLAMHPLARYLATFAGSDAALVFSLALATLFASRLAEKPTWPRARLLGAVIGIGGATKLSPLGISVALAALALLLLWRHRREQAARRLAKMLLSVPITAALIFVASYPYVWRHPIDHSLNMLRYRVLGFDVQGALWQQVAVDSPLEAIERSWNRFASAEWSVLGRFFWWSVPNENGLALTGAIVLTVLVIRRGLTSSAALIATTIGASTAITIVGMQVDWARYHFPILLAIALCIGVAVGSVEQWLWKRVR